MTTRKRVESRLSAWWSAWKYVAIALLLLAASLWFNLRQYVASKTAPIKAENKAMAETLDTIKRIGEIKVKDDDQLRLDIDAIAKRARQARADYDKAATTRPLPAQCAPGQARMDAVNKGVPLTPTPGARRER